MVKAAKWENRSISDLVREIVHDWIRNQGSEALWRERMQAVKELARLQLQIQEEHGIYQGNLTEEARTERGADFISILRPGFMPFMVMG